jgi:Protein of unknown function (DUF3558)
VQRFAGFALLLATGLGLAGCDGRATGSPQPAPGSADRSSGVGASQGGTASSPPTAGSGPLSEIDPCHLITRNESTVFGITGAEPSAGYGARSCKYTATNGEYGVDIRERQGIDQFNTSLGPAADMRIGGRPAKRQEASTGSCGIAVGITATSRVDIVHTTLSANAAEACPKDQQMAELVASKITGN